jgi:hypothetical protein
VGLDTYRLPLLVGFDATRCCAELSASVRAPPSSPLWHDAWWPVAAVDRRDGTDSIELQLQIQSGSLNGSAFGPRA